MDETSRLRAALLDVADPATAVQRDNPGMSWSEVLVKAGDAEVIKGYALRALANEADHTQEQADAQG